MHVHKTYKINYKSWDFKPYKAIPAKFENGIITITGNPIYY